MPRGLLCAAALAALAPAVAAAAPPGFAFLAVPAGARASALGGAYGALADGVEAAFWNPAGLAGVHGIQATGTHYEYFQSLRHDQFALAGRWWGTGVAGAVRALYSEPISARDEIGDLVGTFGGHDLEFALGAGRALGGGVRAGATALVLRERIAELAATTYAFSLGASWDPVALPGLRVSVAGRHLGPAAHYDFGGERGQDLPLPVAVETGLAYRSAAGGAAIRGAVESRLTRGRAPLAMTGVEVEPGHGAALRLGLRMNDDAAALAAGVGYTYRALRFDYAFVPSRLDLGDTHRVSLFGQF